MLQQSAIWTEKMGPHFSTLYKYDSSKLVQLDNFLNGKLIPYVDRLFFRYLVAAHSESYMTPLINWNRDSSQDYAGLEAKLTEQEAAIAGGLAGFICLYNGTPVETEAIELLVAVKAQTEQVVDVLKAQTDRWQTRWEGKTANRIPLQYLQFEQALHREEYAQLHRMASSYIEILQNLVQSLPLEVISTISG